MRDLVRLDWGTSSLPACDFDDGACDCPDRFEFGTLHEPAVGGLCNAQWGMDRVARYRRDGNEDRIVAVPTCQPTRRAVGGAGPGTLYVTSANDSLDDDAVAREPLAGDAA